jgi:hypothetical protein
MYQLGKLYSLINEKSREDEEKVAICCGNAGN